VSDTCTGCAQPLDLTERHVKLVRQVERERHGTVFVEDAVVVGQWHAEHAPEAAASTEPAAPETPANELLASRCPRCEKPLQRCCYTCPAGAHDDACEGCEPLSTSEDLPVPDSASVREAGVHPDQSAAVLQPGDGVRALADQLEQGGDPTEQVPITRGALVHLYRELERLYPIAFRASQVLDGPSKWTEDDAHELALYILGEKP